MPRAFDRAITPPPEWDPERLQDYALPQLPSDFAEMILAAVMEVATKVIQHISDTLGFDLMPFLGAANAVIINLQTIFGSLNPLTGEFNPQAAVQALFNIAFELGITLPVAFFQELLEYFRLDLGSFLGLIPLGSISNVSPNLLVNPTFTSPEAINGSLDEGWEFDAETTRTDDGTGSAKVTADGTLKAMRSNKIPIAPDQGPHVSVWVKWSGLVSTGSPIQLQVQGYNAAGQALGAPELIASVASPGASGGWNHLTGDYTPQPGVALYAVRIVVTAAATAGTVWFDDGASTKDGLLQQSWISGLVDTLADIGSKIQSLLNKIWDGIFGDETGIIDRTAEDIAYALRNIPALNVIGVGAATMVDTVTDVLDFVWRGLTRQPSGSGKSIADVANAASVTSEQADTALQVGEWNNAVLGLRNNKSLMEGMDESEESNFLISELFDGGANPPIIGATSSAVPLAFWRATETAQKGFISWMGRGTTDITALFIDVYRINYSTNTLELLHSSGDQIGQMTSAWSVGVYYMDEADRFQVNAGDVIGVAWRVVGTGTHEIAGKHSPWLPEHPTVHPKKPAAVRTGVGNMALGAISYSGDVPWFGIGIVEGDVPPPYFAPRSTVYTTAGEHTYQIPLSATHLDVVLKGAGGGGQGGSAITFQNGEGGFAGDWEAETLIRGIDFPAEATELTVTVGAGGSGGGATLMGNHGEPSLRHAISGGKAELSAAGGLRGSNIGFGSPYGKPGGDFTYEGHTYVGGQGGAFVGGQSGKNGTAPGAGGGGGSGGTWGVAFGGGDGARGGVWVTARQG